MVEVHRRGEGDEWRCAARRMKSGNEATWVLFKGGGGGK